MKLFELNHKTANYSFHLALAGLSGHIIGTIKGVNFARASQLQTTAGGGGFTQALSAPLHSSPLLSAFM